MGLLKKLLVSYENKEFFKNTLAIFIQHQLGNHFSLAYSYIELGLNPKNLFWIDIPYTSSNYIRSGIHNFLKVPEENFIIHDYCYQTEYCDYQVNRIKGWIKNNRRIFYNNHEILVLDDGGYFIKALELIDDKNLTNIIEHNVKIVEQTSRGIEQIKSSPIKNRFSIINVAEAVFKKQYESEYISIDIIESFNESLNNNYLEKSLYESNILILGFGSIGEKVASSIIKLRSQSKDKIYIWDINQAKIKDSNKMGFRIFNPEIKYKLVFGCTGNNSFNFDMFNCLENSSFLVSTSSGNVEFLLPKLNNSEIDNLNDFKDDGHLHSTITLTYKEKLIYLLNCGFPINFNGNNLFRIPESEIQYTVLLMLFGGIQAIQSDTKGIKKFSEYWDNFLIQNYCRQHQI